MVRTAALEGLLEGFMRKSLSLLTILFLASALLSCAPAPGRNSPDGTAPVIIGLASQDAESAPQPTAEPTPVPTPEAEWPVPAEGSEDPAGVGSGNDASEIRMAAYGEKLYYIGQTGNSNNKTAPRNLWEINWDGSGRRAVANEEDITKNVADLSGYSFEKPVSVYKVENGRIYFFVNVIRFDKKDEYVLYTFLVPYVAMPEEEAAAETNDDDKYQMYSVDLQGEGMRLEEDDAGKYLGIGSNSVVAGEYTYTQEDTRILRKPETGDAEVIYQNDAGLISNLTVQGDWAYFLERQQDDYELCKIHCVNGRTHVEQTILELPRDSAFFVRRISVLGNWVYFINEGCLLCRVPINGGTVETLLADPVFDYVLFGRTIFYYAAEVQNMEGLPTGMQFSTLLRRADLDGANDTAIDTAADTAD
jgi:hypothetical protein